VTDQRQRRALGPVNELVGEFDRERDGQAANRRLSASIKTHAGHATAVIRPAHPLKRPGAGPECGAREPRTVQIIDF
jgi:hypothetical protein